MRDSAPQEVAPSEDVAAPAAAPEDVAAPAAAPEAVTAPSAAPVAVPAALPAAPAPLAASSKEDTRSVSPKKREAVDTSARSSNSKPRVPAARTAGLYKCRTTK